jgi:hypothetical protein
VPELLPKLQSVGIRRGLLGGSRAWTVVAVAALGLRLLRRLAGDGDEVVYSEELGPGESLLITHGNDTHG